MDGKGKPKLIVLFSLLPGHMTLSKKMITTNLSRDLKGDLHQLLKIHQKNPKREVSLLGQIINRNKNLPMQSKISQRKTYQKSKAKRYKKETKFKVKQLSQKPKNN